MTSLPREMCSDLQESLSTSPSSPKTLGLVGRSMYSAAWEAAPPNQRKRRWLPPQS